MKSKNQNEKISTKSKNENEERKFDFFPKFLYNNIRKVEKWAYVNTATGFRQATNNVIYKTITNQITYEPNGSTMENNEQPPTIRLQTNY